MNSNPLPRLGFLQTAAIFWLILPACLCPAGATAQSSAFTYQGRLQDGTNPANGSYEILFRPFAVLAGGSQLTIPNIRLVAVTNGLFTTVMDFGSAIFDGGPVYLQVEVRTNGVGGYAILAPRQALTPTPYAVFSSVAGNVPAGVIGSSQLADSIGLGTTNVNGRLDVYRTSNGLPAVSLIGGASQVSTYGDTGQEETRLQANSYGGRLTTRDELGGLTTLLGSATTAGGVIQAYQANGNLGVVIDGDTSGNGGGGQMRVRASDGGLAVSLSATNSQFSAYGSDGEEKARLAGGSWGQLFLNSGRPSNERAVTLSALGPNGGGYLSLANTNGATRVSMSGESVARGGGVFVSDANGTITFELDGAETSGTGSQLIMKQADGTQTVQIDAEAGAGGGGYLRLYKGDGSVGLTLQADTGGESKVTTQVLQITGGSDLSEQFDIHSPEALMPGTLVCIDPEHPGQLIASDEAYDRTVAGVVSGAGGVKPGMLMGQAGTVADGRHPVALSGRVYCRADASNGPIRPGDLLTTSNQRGHAMKVTDHDKAHGAIIGKAMSSLESGEGLVLVLVSLQ